MACSRGAASPDTFTKNKLFSKSGGFCQNPDCNQPLFKTLPQKEIHIAEIAHIISVGDGARNNSKLPPKVKGSFENLILLCPVCHTIIDKSEEDFPESLILQWKNDHEQRIEEIFSVRLYQTRAEVRQVLQPLFRENKTIFDTYGPHSGEQFNPESNYPRIWLRKIREFIIPNNKKIVKIIDKNQSLLSDDELLVFELFKHHADDFEGKHLFNLDTSGLTFPPKIVQLYV